ncbi:hypothetical protein TSAR_005083 [Trichomalopsis sarcophagae]|uniref:AB hydrolase-1 domain-containing protein n=1 Tax=Trichomalopsis sarcophagae TaxID=543379 RepID=A0A232EVM2_9HYME|nr:hypothetical protein TSAR_005083 [Trichomalopsis sarcophagae]
MTNPGKLTLNVPWGHIAAKTWGKPEDTHVLMVHGIMDNAGTFDRLVELLPQNFYYVCIDLPGHGLSSHFQPGVPLNYVSYVLAIRYVLDELRWKNTYYIAHSLGAHLGLLFAIVYPERIRKLILIDGIIARPIPNAELISRIREEHDLAIKAYKLKNPRHYTKEDVMYALGNLRKCCLSTEAAKKIFDRSVTKVGDNAYCYNRDYRARISIIPNFNKDQTLYLLSQLKVDTLIFMATDTLPFIKYLKPDVIEELKPKKNVNIIEIEGNHDVHNNYPHRVSGHISKFLCHIPSKL